MRVLLVQVDRLDHSRFTEEDRDLLLFAISNIAQEVIPEGTGCRRLSSASRWCC